MPATVDQVSSSNRKILELFYRAINERDHTRGRQLLSPEFEWRVPHGALHSGTHTGRDEAARVVETQLEVFDRFEIEVEELHGRGQLVVAFVRQRARGGASGAEVEIRIAHLWTIAGGKLERLEEFPECQAALEAMASSSTAT